MQVRSSLILLAAVLLICNGCSDKNDPHATITELKQAFPNATSAGPSANHPGNAASTPIDVNGSVGQAISALQSNDYVNAVLLLSTVRKQRDVTAEQHMAAQETIEKINRHLATRAAQGDEKAKATMAELEQKRLQ
jgi:hypothetical protein